MECGGKVTAESIQGLIFFGSWRCSVCRLDRLCSEHEADSIIDRVRCLRADLADAEANISHAKCEWDDAGHPNIKPSEVEAARAELDDALAAFAEQNSAVTNLGMKIGYAKLAWSFRSLAQRMALSANLLAAVAGSLAFVLAGLPALLIWTSGRMMLVFGLVATSIAVCILGVLANYPSDREVRSILRYLPQRQDKHRRLKNDVSLGLEKARRRFNALYDDYMLKINYRRATEKRDEIAAQLVDAEAEYKQRLS